MGIDAEMFVRHRNPLSEKRVRQLAADLHAAMGGEVIRATRPGEFSFYPNGKHTLEIIEVYEQDGPDIVPHRGEQFIQVNLWTRYYGEGYERGDWPGIFSVFMWLKANIKDCSVWYGGDSSGVLAEEMTFEFVDKMWRHWATVGHSPYIERDNPYVTEKSDKPTCAFCANRPLWRQMFSPKGDGFTCEGCGLHMMQISKDVNEWIEVDKDWNPLKKSGVK